jgi:hypothetical protein
LYVVLDGSDALRVAVREFFPDAIVQRCLVNKERNIKGKLPKRHWGELSTFLTRLRSVQGLAAAQEVFGELAEFLKLLSCCFHYPRITLRLAVLRPISFPERRGVRVMPLFVFDCAQRLHGCCLGFECRALAA